MANGGAQGEGGAGSLRPAIGETIIAVGMLVLAVVVFWQTATISVSPVYAQVGPTVVPYITASGLALFGLLLLYSALTGGWQPVEEKEVTPDWQALLWGGPGPPLNGLLITYLGFTIASLPLFAPCARRLSAQATP